MQHTLIQTSIAHPIYFLKSGSIFSLNKVLPLALANLKLGYMILKVVFYLFSFFHKPWVTWTLPIVSIIITIAWFLLKAAVSYFSKEHESFIGRRVFWMEVQDPFILLSSFYRYLLFRAFRGVNNLSWLTLAVFFHALIHTCIHASEMVQKKGLDFH